MTTYCGQRNPFWRGGRSIASNGYVLIRVGVGHHLADVRGYAYEHRLKAEEKLGRRLLPGEQVHHLDGNQLNNELSNLEVQRDIAHHRLQHRRAHPERRLPDEPNGVVDCACGCGQRFERFDGSGRPRRFVNGHYQRGARRIS
jgi:hypothetical protein